MKQTNALLFLIIFLFANSVFAGSYHFKDYGKFYYSGRGNAYNDGFMTGFPGRIELEEKLKHRVFLKIYQYEQLIAEYSLRLEQIIDSTDAEGNPFKEYVGIISEGSLKNETATIIIQKNWMIFDVNQFELFFDFLGIFGDPGAASGSGFAINKHTIITNQHVVSGLDLFWAIKNDGNEKKAHKLEVLYEDASLDLAVLTSKDSLVACEVDRNVYDIGENIYVFGFPQIDVQGESLKMTKGIISSRMGILNTAETYQIDAAIQPGNSGGPLVRNDKIIGIVRSTLEGSQLVNYAIKSIFLGAILDVLNIQNEGSANPKECTYSIQGQTYKFYREQMR